MIDEATVEHASAKQLIAEIKSMKPGDDLYDAKVKVLGEYINHHVEEEQTEMFKEGPFAQGGTRLGSGKPLLPARKSGPFLAFD